MAEPKKRLTSTRSGNRRSHLALNRPKLALCRKCKNPVLPHRVCPTCGFYRNQNILKLAEKEKAKQERKKQRQEEEKLE